MMSQLENNQNTWNAIGECTIYQMTSLKDELTDFISQKEQVTLDLSKLEQFDVSFVQLLLSVQMQAVRDDIKFTIKNISDDLINLIHNIHCDSVLIDFVPLNQQGDDNVS
jgi:ABC-type transporter Mla MlaB component